MNYENGNTIKEMAGYTENMINIMTMESVYKWNVESVENSENIHK